MRLGRARAPSPLGWPVVVKGHSPAHKIAARQGLLN